MGPQIGLTMWMLRYGDRDDLTEKSMLVFLTPNKDSKS